MQKNNTIKNPISIEVVYATKAAQDLVVVFLPEGSLIRDAIEASLLLAKYPDLDLTKNKVGVWGKICALDEIVFAGARIEIYRDLLIDPMETRRITALRSKKAQARAKELAKLNNRC